VAVNVNVLYSKLKSNKVGSSQSKVNDSSDKSTESANIRGLSGFERHDLLRKHGHEAERNIEDTCGLLVGCCPTCLNAESRIRCNK
jgi:hypothetical protein